ncbi:MAG: hypothetical protein ACI4A5_06125 [Hominilimicola sp.]
MDIKVVSDNEKPEITVETYKKTDTDGKEKTMARVKVSDNNLIAAFCCTAYNQNGQKVVATKDIYGKEYEWEVDITNVKGIEFTATDIALNTAGVYSGAEILEEDGKVVVKNSSANKLRER